jgi:hypothetical protein
MSQFNPVHSLARYKKGRKDVKNGCTKEESKQERKGKAEY